MGGIMFVKHSGLGKTFPNEKPKVATDWTIERLRIELLKQDVLRAKISPNTETWFAGSTVCLWLAHGRACGSPGATDSRGLGIRPACVPLRTDDEI